MLKLILSLYAGLIATAVILILIGYASERPHAYATGYVFLFLAGVILLGIAPASIGLDNGIDYQAGTNSTVTYTYNATNLTSTNENIDYQYENYTNKPIGFLLSIASIWLFILTLLQTGAKTRR